MATKAKDEGAKTAVDGNAPGGPQYTGSDPFASGGNANLGDQVDPSTQTREDDSRFLAKPRTDPGPDFKAHGHEGWKNPGKGETLNSVNEPVAVTQRHSTAPDWAGKPGHNVSEAKLGAHVVGAETLASNVYHPEKGEGLTDMAMAKSGEEREVSPGATPPANAEQQTAATGNL